MNNSIAVIAAHPDDEVLGCGGTIAKFASEGSAVHVLVLADGESSRDDSAENAQPDRIMDRKDMAVRAGEILGVASIELLDLPDNRLDSLALLDVVKSIEKFIDTCHPSTILTHYSGDVNIDHRVVHDAVITACRPQPGFPVKELLFFEVPSSTEWRPPASAQMFNPNWFVDISNEIDLKIKALEAYLGELRTFPHPRSTEAVQALAKWRGATVGVRAAEAFILGRKLV